MLEHLHKNDVNSALKEIFRVLKSNHYALLAPATKPDLTGYFHLTVESKEWWDEFRSAEPEKRRKMSKEKISADSAASGNVFIHNK